MPVLGIISHIKEEFTVIKERDPAIKSPMEVLLYPSFRVMLSYRRAHKLYLKGHFFWARVISQRAARKQCYSVSGCDTRRYRKRDRKTSSDDRG